MFCANCGYKLDGNESFCGSCGCSIKELKEEPGHEKLMDFTGNQDFVEKPNKKNISKMKIILISIIFLCIISTILINIFNVDDEVVPNNVVEGFEVNDIENNKDMVENDSIIAYNTLQKLKNDYESGKIDINKYFTELYYYEYEAINLAEEYKSDYEFFSSGCQSELLDLLEKYEEKLDKDIVKKYLQNVSLANVSLGESDYTVLQSNFTNDYKIRLLGNSYVDSKIELISDTTKNEKENVNNHILNKVCLSRNGHFLIWYTNIGEDAITEEQINSISDGLEDAIEMYENKFNIEYSYDAYVDNRIFNEDYKNAKNVLKTHDISVDTLKTAMSVYVFNSGSDEVFAQYCDEEDGAKIINRTIYADILDNDGIVNYPYILINKKGFNSNDSLRQLYSHELFHHMQFVYCKELINKRAVAGDYGEGMANCAATVISEYNGRENFLNEWAMVYTKNINSKISQITDGKSYGYGTFPYLYTFFNMIDNAEELLMKAHTQTDPYLYLKENTSKEDLSAVSSQIAYNVLAKSFDNNALFSQDDPPIQEIIGDFENLNMTINPGAVVYYEIDKNSELSVNSGNADYVGIELYGYLQEEYSKLLSSKDKLDVNLTNYDNYDKFYLAIYNASLTDCYTYDIIVKKIIEFAENQEFITTFNNYNIEIKMDVEVMGINLSTVSTGVVDELHQKEFLDVTSTTMNVAQLKNKVYYDFNSGYSYMTQPYGGDVWWKSKDASQMVDLGVILDKLKNMENVKTIDSNHYKVKMDKNEVEGVISAGNVDNLKLNKDIEVDVYTQNGYITKLEYDFSNFIEGIGNFTAEITFSNYNNAGDVKIPKSIIDGAKVQ